MTLNLSEYFKDYILKFKVYNTPSLFSPDFNLLKEMRCPICTRKLYWNKNKSKAFCKSKVKDRFFISRNTMSRIGAV